MTHDAHQLNGWVDLIVFVSQRLLQFVDDEHFGRWCGRTRTACVTVNMCSLHARQTMNVDQCMYMLYVVGNQHNHNNSLDMDGKQHNRVIRRKTDDTR